MDSAKKKLWKWISYYLNTNMNNNGYYVIFKRYISNYNRNIDIFGPLDNPEQQQVRGAGL